MYGEEDIGKELPGGNRVKGMETHVEVLAMHQVWGALPAEEARHAQDTSGRRRDTSEGSHGLEAEGPPHDACYTTEGCQGSKLDNSRHLILLRASPVTGRTHQIRLHCSFLKVPLVGDVKYGGVTDVEDLVYKRRNRLAPCSELGLPDGSVALHAAALSINHPRSREKLDLESPLPPWASCFEEPPYSLHGTKLVECSTLNLCM